MSKIVDFVKARFAKKLGDRLLTPTCPCSYPSSVLLPLIAINKDGEPYVHSLGCPICHTVIPITNGKLPGGLREVEPPKEPEADIIPMPTSFNNDNKEAPK